MNAALNKLYDNLLTYWQTVVDDLVKELTIAYAGSSGNTRQAIGKDNAKPVSLTASGFKVTITMPDYYLFLDEGVSGARYNKNISRFKYDKLMPPISAIRKFMQNRGITQPKQINRKNRPKNQPIKRKQRPKNTRAGRKRDKEDILNGIAFAIAYSIWERGLKKTEFYSKVINDKKLLELEASLIQQYSAYVLETIKVD